MKKLFAIILAFVMVLSLAACGAAPAVETTGTATPETTGETSASQTDETVALKRITVTVVHADGSSKVFEYETEEEFLGPLLVAEGLIQGEDGPYGLNIIQVDGETAIYESDGAYWALYEGDEYALQGVDTTPVVDEGTYKLEYTRG